MSAVRFLAFTVVRAWQGFWRNAMMSLAATATVVLMLVLLSGLFIVITGLNSGLEFIEGKVGVTARLVDGLPDIAVDRLIDRVEALPGVASAEYVSPAEAMARLQETYRQRGQTLDLGGADGAITIYASIEVKLSDADQSSAVAAALSRETTTVDRITTNQSEYEQLLGITNLIRNVGLVAIGLVGLTVLFMIVNTIRIAVFSRSNEIEIMRLVGASDSFIRWPFILEGMLCGLVGALVSIILVALVWDPIQPVMFDVFKVSSRVGSQFLATLSALLLGAGLGVGALGSWISVRSYLADAT
jgi:cell division transport system permease protein